MMQKSLLCPSSRCAPPIERGVYGAKEISPKWAHIPPLLCCLPSRHFSLQNPLPHEPQACFQQQAALLLSLSFQRQSTPLRDIPLGPRCAAWGSSLQEGIGGQNWDMWFEESTNMLWTLCGTGWNQGKEKEKMALDGGLSICPLSPGLSWLHIESRNTTWSR